MSSKRLHFAAGDIVFREGDPPTSAYLVESGQIEILTVKEGVPMVLSVLGPGDLLGEMAVIDDAPRTATARALSEASLIEVDRAQINERIDSSDPIVRALLKGQLSRYRSALQALRSGEAPVLPAPGERHRHDADGYDDQAVAKIHLETQLRDSLASRSLEVRFQPIYEIRERRISGYEALVRWTHPVRGPISPAEFIALAEETSLILPVGEYVLERVAETLAKLADRGVAPLPFIAVNMSGRQLAESDMLGVVTTVAEKHGIDARAIKIEITESLMLDFERVGELISRCDAVGIKVALDDFGTGYSNLGHLHKLQFSTVKLDQGFVRQMVDAPRCHAIVQAIVQMVHALDSDIVAEGVETEDQLQALDALSCRYAQGYLIGRPQTYDEMCRNHGLD
ncbi:MAG TPA: EAL domain-containing protein [Patescibacteria group bacterium]|nr:EAL domain-containing protein [Patescibacteria group bacterium]